MAWRRVGAAAARAGARPETVQLLAESIFAYIDELSAASVAGYAEAQSAAAGEREARRRALAEMLLRDPAAAPAVLEAAVNDGGWTAPRTLAAVVVDGGAATAGSVARLRSAPTPSRCRARTRGCCSSPIPRGRDGVTR